MLIPIRTDYRLTRTPWVNYLLVAANVVIFVLGLNGQNALSAPLMLHPDQPQVYQFFTSAFLHAAWWHLLGNMVFLWVFGNAINDKFGHLGYLAFYLAGGVLAGIGYVLMSGYAPVLGASGAIAAVTGAYLVLLPRARVTLLLFMIFIMPIEVSSLLFLAFQFLFNLAMSWNEPHSDVAYWAHNSGYIFGIAVASALLALRILPRDAFDLLNLIRAAHRRRQYRRMASSGYDPFAQARASQPASRWVASHTVESVGPDSPAIRELELRRTISDAFAHHDVATAAETYLHLLQVAEGAVLARQEQLDVANQLMATERYPQAADAYERLLRHYGDYAHVADIYLMLGLLYGRYLQQDDRATQYLQRAIDTLRDPRKIEMARADLQAVRQRHG